MYYLQENLFESIVNNNSFIHENVTNIINYSIDTQIKPVLICRFSSLSCKSCVNFIEKKIKQHFTNIDSEPILFIEFEGGKESYLNGIRCINIESNKIGLSIEETNLPFLFLLIDNKVQHFFLPDINFPEYTDLYLQNIKKRYFE